MTTCQWHIPKASTQAMAKVLVLASSTKSWCGNFQIMLKTFWHAPDIWQHFYANSTYPPRYLGHRNIVLLWCKRQHIFWMNAVVHWWTLEQNRNLTMQDYETWIRVQRRLPYVTLAINRYARLTINSKLESFIHHPFQPRDLKHRLVNKNRTCSAIYDRARFCSKSIQTHPLRV